MSGTSITEQWVQRIIDEATAELRAERDALREQLTKANADLGITLGTLENERQQRDALVSKMGELRMERDKAQEEREALRVEMDAMQSRLSALHRIQTLLNYRHDGSQHFRQRP